MNVRLNTRHKIGLFLTALAVGLWLCAGTTFRDACGIAIIGTALTWALGSDLRILRWSIGLISIIIVLGPVMINVVDNYRTASEYRQSIERFRARLPSLAREHPDVAAGIIPRHNDPYEALAALEGGTPSDDGKVDVWTRASRTLGIPNVGEIYFPPDVTSKEIAEAFKAAKDHKQPPSWYFQALYAGVDPAQIMYLSPPGEEPKNRTDWTAITEGLWIELPALALALVFLLSLIPTQRLHRTQMQE